MGHVLPIEKVCSALIFIIQKMCHYLHHHHMNLISKADPFKNILNRPTQNRWLAKWAVLIQQYDIKYVSEKAIKGQALTNFLAAHSILDSSPLTIDLPNKWLCQ